MEKARIFRASSYRISKDKEMKQEISERVMRKAICRPRKISPRIGSQLLRQISKLRREEGHFTVKRLMKQAGLNNKEVTIHTGLRFLRSKGYKYIQPCQKGLLTGSDLRKRFQFAKEMKEYNYNVWTEKNCYFLRRSFVHMFNPAEQARARRGRLWRKESEGLSYGCTAKTSHGGISGRVAKFVLAITYK